MPPPDPPRRQIVICDASPLIFLAEVGALDLIAQVVPGHQVVLGSVAREVLSERAGPVEVERLRRWMQSVEVIEYEGSLFPSSALSRNDRSTLAWGVNCHADWLIADERLLRRFARDHGVNVIGFCGILAKAVERSFLEFREAQGLLDTAVDLHGLQISVALYRRITEALSRVAC